MAATSKQTFPNPWQTVTTLITPRSFRRILDYCEFIWQHDLTLRQAMHQITAYFITNIEVQEVPGNDTAGEELLNRVSSVLNDQLDIIEALKCRTYDQLCYGNSFTSLILPIKRLLTCPICGSTFAFKNIANNTQFNFKYDASKVHFIGSCLNAHCSYRGKFDVTDYIEDAEKHATFRHWSPREIDIVQDRYSLRKFYIWKIPSELKNQVRQGHIFTLEATPLSVLEAVSRNHDFRFKDGVLYHGFESVPSGFTADLAGWGLPKILTAFSAVWYHMSLMRINEAIALDYTAPLRILCPGISGSGGEDYTSDPAGVIDYGAWGMDTADLIQAHRMDPTTIQTSSFPLQYVICGGEAKHLVPDTLLQNAEDYLLNGLGVPPEMYRANMQWQSAPACLRIFESLWQGLNHANDRFLQWLVQKLTQQLGWQPVKVKITPTHIVDNLERQAILMQLVSMGEGAVSRLFEGIGLDYKTEAKRNMSDQALKLELQADQQEKLENQALGQQVTMAPPLPQQQAGMPADMAAAGGTPAPVGTMSPSDQQAQAQMAQGGTPPPLNKPVSPIEMLSQADVIAQSFVTMDSAQRRQELNRLDMQNPILAAAVRDAWGKLRQSLRHQGGSAITGGAI